LVELNNLIYYIIIRMSSVLEPPTLVMGSFHLMIKSEDQEIDLTKFTKSFNLDVELNPSGTYLQQEQDGIITAVSKSFVKMCVPNKNQNIARPTGFVKIQYSKKTKKTKNAALAGFQGRQTISRPPVGPIPQGAWCSVCKNYGPDFHKENCSDPIEDKLRITLFGFITCVLEKGLDNEIDPELVPLRDRFILKIGDRTNITKSEYLNYFEEIDKSDFLSNQEPVDDWPLLNIHYKKVIKQVGPKNKKDKSFFSNTAIVSYNFENSGSVSVRVYNSGLIHLVSCPWEHKDFYIKFVQRLNQADGIESSSTHESNTYIINTNESLVNSVFSSYSLFGEESKDLDLEKLYNYFWPVNEDNQPILNKISPKRVFTKRYKAFDKEVDHNYLVNPFSDTNKFYRFDIEYRNDLSTPKIIMKMIPCLGNKEIPNFCKPYKITVMIFKSGKVQSIFSYCKDEDVGLTEDKLCDENPFITPDNILDQYIDIQKELEMCMDFIFNSVDRISNTVVVESNQKLEKKEINTVSGISPYKKKENINIGETVELFNKELMTWDRTGEITDNDNEFYTVELIEDDEKTGEVIENLKLGDIRPTQQSSMQIARSKIAGTDIPNKPDPYSFRGKCAGGDKYYIPMEGRQARDNLYYPYCSVKNKDKYNLHIDRILEGFPGEEESDFNIEKDAEFDVYSGILKKGTNDIGKLVKFMSDGEQYEGVIIDKHRTSDRGLDNIVIYKVETEDEIFEIQGSDLIPGYREDRRWDGLGNPKMQKIKLLECAKKLGLSQSPYTTEIRNIKLQNRVMEYLLDITGKESGFVHNTSVLTPTTFTKFQERAYMGVVFPSGSQRVMLLSHKGKHYFIDESMLIMKLDFDIDTEFTVLLDGYIKRTDVITYYPIDCLIFNGKKMNNDYFNDQKELNSEDEMFEFIESLDLDGNNYVDIIENLKYGRLFYTIMMGRIYGHKNIKNVNFAKPEQYIVPFVGEVNRLGRVNLNPNSLKDRSIIEDVQTLFKNSKNSLDITFIPQKGTGNFLRWKRHLKTPVILELLKKSKEGYTVGMNGEYLKPINNRVIPIPASIISKIKNKKRKFIKFDLNFMNNGKLNPDDPVTLDVVDPIVTNDDALTHTRTQLIINAMISPIPERIFMSRIEWKLFVPKYIVLVADDEDPGISPLVISE